VCLLLLGDSLTSSSPVGVVRGGIDTVEALALVSFTDSSPVGSWLVMDTAGYVVIVDINTGDCPGDEVVVIIGTGDCPGDEVVVIIGTGDCPGDEVVVISGTGDCPGVDVVFMETGDCPGDEVVVIIGTGDCPGVVVVFMETGDCPGDEVVCTGTVAGGGPAWHCENVSEVLGSVAWKQNWSS